MSPFLSNHIPQGKGGGGYLGPFLLGMSRWPYLIIVFSVADYRLHLFGHVWHLFGQIRNFRDPTLVTFCYACTL